MPPNPTPPPPPRQSLGLSLALSIPILIVAAICFGIWQIHRAMQSAFIAEERLHVSGLVCDLIAEHVETSPTHSWPTSWKDLERLPAREIVYRWPQDADKVRALVAVDFTVAVADVLKQSPETCTAIRVTPGPNIPGVPQRWFYDLFDRLKAATEPTDSPPAPNRDG